MKLILEPSDLNMYAKKRYAKSKSMVDIEIDDFMVSKAIYYHSNRVTFEDGQSMKVLKDTEL